MIPLKGRNPNEKKISREKTAENIYYNWTQELGGCLFHQHLKVHHDYADTSTQIVGFTIKLSQAKIAIVISDRLREVYQLYDSKIEDEKLKLRKVGNWLVWFFKIYQT